MVGQAIFEYILYPTYFLVLPASSIYIISLFITITIKWCFVDIVDDGSYFEFPPEVDFTFFLYVHVVFATDTEAESLCFVQLPQ